jgi:hypothetical protein
MKGSPRRLALLAVAVIATLAIAIPVIAADPSSSPPGQTKPEKSPKPGKSGNPGQEKKAERDKAPKTPEVDVTVEGTVQQSTDDKGRPTFTLTAAGKTWELSAGPPWYWGDKNPLKAFVGKSVKIAGSTHEGSTELDVETVDGTAIRAAGKPPWAGGPWAVGSIHPGGKPWMADGKPGHGRDKAPGQNKDKSPDSTENEQPGS